MSDIGYSWGMTGHDTNTKGTTMNEQIQARRADWIRREDAGCVYYIHRTLRSEIIRKDNAHGRWIASFNRGGSRGYRCLFTAMTAAGKDC